MNMIEGQRIVEFETIKSMFDNDSIRCVDDAGVEYRMQVKELHKIICMLDFEIEEKRVHKYLKITDRCADALAGLDEG